MTTGRRVDGPRRSTDSFLSAVDELEPQQQQPEAASSGPTAGTDAAPSSFPIAPKNQLPDGSGRHSDQDSIMATASEALPGSPGTMSSAVTNSHPKSFDELPENVKEQWHRWTGNPKAFSRAVLQYARNHVWSDAYLMGGVGESGGFLDTSLGDNKDEVSKVANPSHSFRLQWHRAVLHAGAPETRLPTEVSDKLTQLHAAQNLWDIAAMVKKDPNYLAEKTRYPELSSLIDICNRILNK